MAARRLLLQLLQHSLKQPPRTVSSSRAAAAAVVQHVAATAPTPLCWRQQQHFSTSQAGQAANSNNGNTSAAAGTSVSQAVACMVDRDVMPRQQLLSRMDALSQQLAQQVATFSSTELSAFAEACRQMGFRHPQAFTAIVQQLAPQASSIAVDELPSLLWAASTLAADKSAPAGASAAQHQSAQPPQQPRQQQQQPAASSSSSSSSEPASSRYVAVPQHDGVAGAVNSSRISGLPDVVEFMLGASQVLSGDLDGVESQELPVVVAALADLEYRDPFLLTVVAESILERKAELTEPELVALITSFSAMGRHFFDNRVLNQLTDELVTAARAGQSAAQESVEMVAECLAGINHKHRGLSEYLAERTGA